MSIKAKFLILSLLLLVPLQSLYSQNRTLGTNFTKPDSIYSKLLLHEKRPLKSNLLLKLNIDDLDLFYQNHSGEDLYFSYYYLNKYDITQLEKNEIDANLIFALKNTLYTEDETVAFIIKYLGISRDLFAIILAVIHLVKYR